MLAHSVYFSLKDPSEAAINKHMASVFTKLELPATEDDNRRVLAVLAYLRGTAK